MPFRYGIATMTDVPQIYVRLWVEVDDEFVQCGVACDCLPPKWFTKDPVKPVEAEIQEMLTTIRTARQHSLGLTAGSVFGRRQQIYASQQEWAKGAFVPPLLAHLGTSLIERALIDA